MELILLEKIGKLGDLGTVVKVRNGYGRNFLIPQGKALPATPANRARFEAERQAFEARQEEIKQSAENLATQIQEVTVVLDRPAGSSDKLFGSVTNGDIANFFQEKGITVPRSTIDVPRPIRTLGEHLVRIRLHPDVIPEITISITRRV
ncbi:50S ribosomal protein L9, partial [Candidatus Magnetaquicoccus inordinatus]|uniref:50S ribosomal protein L9 n=1 Tax=Candidatus Magnetaquicoccus inordinatus TaxID=2496818 RepID=UPI00102CD252